MVSRMMDTISRLLPGVLNNGASFQDESFMGDGLLEYIVRAWCKSEDYWTVYSAAFQALKDAFDAQRSKLDGAAKSELESLTASLGRTLADGYRRAKARSVAAAGTGLNIGNVERQRRLELASAAEKAGGYSEKIAAVRADNAAKTEALRQKYLSDLESLYAELDKARQKEVDDLYKNAEKYFTAPGTLIRIR